MARKPEEVEAAIELARAAGVSEALLERMGGYTGCVGVLDTGRPGPVTTLRFDIDCLAIEETKDENHLPNREGFASPRVAASPTPAGTTATRPWALASRSGSPTTRRPSAAR